MSSEKSQRNVLIIGGYGNAGFLIAKYLLQETDDQVCVTVAGRTLEKAHSAVEVLNRLPTGQ